MNGLKARAVMIVERRAVLFPPAEFLDAVSRYAVHCGRRWPFATPSAFRFDPAADVALRIDFLPASGENSDEKFTFTGRDVESALLEYCLEHRIPLPKRANKRVEKWIDGAALTFQLGDDRGPRILIIDDQEFMRTIVKAMLAKANPSQVSEASNGLEALGLLRRGEADPDVIICDLHMDRMDGLEFLRALRNDGDNAHRDKPVLILTSDRSEWAHSIALRMGAIKVLTKPTTADELILHVNLARGQLPRPAPDAAT